LPGLDGRPRQCPGGRQAGPALLTAKCRDLTRCCQAASRLIDGFVLLSRAPYESWNKVMKFAVQSAMTGAVTAAGGLDMALGDESRQGALVRNAFAVLRVLGRMHQPVGVTKVAAEVGIPKTTAHRLLEHMARENVVVRRDRRWALGTGLPELDRRYNDLESIASPRLYAMTQATGATLFLYAKSGTTLSALSRSYGPGIGRVMTASHQALAAEHPDSAIWKALNGGQLAAEYREVHPDCCGIATPLCLPSGATVALALALPDGRAIEALKRPLDRLASQIVADINRLDR
jgi:IclR family transcriptional regulator, acetate operon repressor